ncbi:hypothetical protein AtDm6_0923 [Acetobacter tropicalis]|uniref:Uncharacterized protein n=1 Tax=Acetobacter tropicalis TaxID=104102 RepID=A0A094YV29_9PROT|nr:hypothetical protein AtDm6_0923 [Acetobacter tropicalis]
MDKSHCSVTLQYTKNGGFLRLVAFPADSDRNRLDVAEV